MSNEIKLLLIDGNNTCHKVYWAMKASKQDLSFAGRHVEVIYGFFRQLISLHKEYPDYLRVVAWDRGYTRRLVESERGVQAGIIPSTYKATRNENIDEERKEQLESIRSQMEELFEGLKLVKCLQVGIQGVEADDIINSYVQNYRKWGGKFVIVSSDKDFYQLLGKDLVIRRSDSDIWTDERFQLETGIAPELWVDAGALMGEKSDNIIGCNGWGAVTACKYIQQYGNLEAIIEAIKNKTKRSKKEEELLNSIPKVRLAKSLKSMDIIPDLPKLKCEAKDEEKLKKYLLDWGFVSLIKDSWRLV